MARKITGLTNTQVERAKYDQLGKNELNDRNGLFLQLMTTGTKIWRFRYTDKYAYFRTVSWIHLNLSNPVSSINQFVATLIG